VAHFLIFCHAHEHARQALVRSIGRDAANIKKLLSTAKYLPHLFRFVAATNRLHTVFGNIPEIEEPEHG
jgi:hypothetical protein